MTGPSAPKDARQKRPAFYVLLDKKVGGVPQDDGRGRHSVYISSDRLPVFARVTGGIEDPQILDLLKDAAGFRRLVHSVGVSVTADDSSLETGFSLIFRGEGGPGSRHSLRFPADGSEHILEPADLRQNEFDAGLGEFLFEFPTVSDIGSATVKFYVNDGFAVPETDPDPAVDFESPAYRAMIARSFLSAGNNARVQSFVRRALAGEPVTAAFLGGSITQGAGAVPLQEFCYARQTVEGLRSRYGSQIRYIKAGVGGTPSETGLMRFDRDITRDGTILPDLVVIEFAVNDAGDETEGVFYESLVRRALALPSHPAVILLFAVFANDWNLKQRLAPIGYRYQLPMVDILEAVSPQFARPEGRVITKRQYFYDVYHPTNLGHRVMADGLLYMIERLAAQQPETDPDGLVPPCYGADYEALQLLDRTHPADALISAGSFTGTDTELQAVPLDDDKLNTPMFPYNWKKESGDEPFRLELTCRRLVLEFKDSGAQDAGRAMVTIDGEKARILDPREAGWTHCHTTVLFNRRESVHHRIEIAMLPEDRDKYFTILGFGYVK